ncbi:MAG: DUF6446 family protein [Pelagimonas sp.]|jgi:hypothetical protein|nr:DUF6446 family protein [Pelagimonas sp.]
MTGKIMAGAIVICGVIAAVAMYYLQVHHFYEEVQAKGTDDVQLTVLASGAPESILYDDFQAIDADSSPIRYRACFRTPMSLAMMTETYEIYEGAEPKVAPGWFDCFDAQEIGAQIASDQAIVFTSQRNFEWGIDRVVAVTSDGRGYVWHEVNDCGDKAYDGTPLGDDCPPRPAPAN